MQPRSRVDPWVWLAGGTTSGRRLQHVSVGNVKIDIAFKGDNELVPNLFFLPMVRSPSNFSSSRATGELGAVDLDSNARPQILHPIAISPAVRPQKNSSLFFVVVCCSDVLTIAPRFTLYLIPPCRGKRPTTAFTQGRSPARFQFPPSPSGVPVSSPSIHPSKNCPFF